MKKLLAVFMGLACAAALTVNAGEGKKEHKKLTKEETAWQQHVQPKVNDYFQKVNALRQKRQEPTTLEWAKKITESDVAILEGKKPYNRDAPKEDVEKLKMLKGHVKQGQFVTKLRKVFTKAEMNEDAWATLNSDTSRPFDKPTSGRIGVKVINRLGDELMKALRVQ